MIGAATMPEPPGGMLSARIVMSPVNHATLRVPFILTVKLYPVTDTNSGDTGRQVDVVRDEQSLVRGEAKYESLMAAAFCIVGQDPRHNTFAFNLKITSLFPECVAKYLIGVSGIGRAHQIDVAEREGPAVRVCEIQSAQEDQDPYEPLHCRTLTWGQSLQVSRSISVCSGLAFEMNRRNPEASSPTPCA